MSDALVVFDAPLGPAGVALPHDLDLVIDAWVDIRARMIREKPEALTRDEWAYLIVFLSRENLCAPFEESFGKRSSRNERALSALYRPRGEVAVWLPNNVSLLGPLTLIYLSLTGQRLCLKAGSRSDDPTRTFLAFARSVVPSGPLARYLECAITCESMERDDPRHAEYAARAAVRIVFGSEDAANAVHSLPHPTESIGFSFVDHQSEAWIEASAMTEQTLDLLLDVFAVYGQAGCTSPRKAVLIGADQDDVRFVGDALIDRWNRKARSRPAVHEASENLLAAQWARANGWDAAIGRDNGVVILSGEWGAPMVPMGRCLAVLGGSLEQAREHLPENIQTIGHVVRDPGEPAWMEVLAKTHVRRFVPLARMHHFGATWDGQEYWRQLFEVVEIGR